MSTLDDVHYGFRHQNKWRSPKIVIYVYSWAISDTALEKALYHPIL